MEYSSTAAERGLKVIIAAAGMAAHLGGGDRGAHDPACDRSADQVRRA